MFCIDFLKSTSKSTSKRLSTVIRKIKHLGKDVDIYNIEQRSQILLSKSAHNGFDPGSVQELVEQTSSKSLKYFHFMHS